MEKKEDSSKDKFEDCLGCRLVSGFGCIGVCSYIIYQARQMKGYNRGGMIAIGSSIGLLGLCRLLGVSPFPEVQAQKFSII